MRIARRIRELAVISAAFVGDAIDRWADRPALENLITELSTRVTELEAENDRLQRELDDLDPSYDELSAMVGKLEDEIEGLRFNGPTLFADEVAALQVAAGLCDKDDVASWAYKHRSTIYALLGRSDHWPQTREEFRRSTSIDPDDPSLKEWE